MDEKIYKTMGSAGASTLAVGICVLAGGITAGILLIVNGARLLKNSKYVIIRICQQLYFSDTLFS